ncbi:DNA polymerase III subunit delta [Psychromicrobium xiongbiense]|uniref:DNA polymerase III subunit delta n=1 Tax=Psychromicrobium xiongbiense TaxID=3051184 RepID=UPI0025526030|nr:DNA polymerase III subunit delta [Psychromicrobium sp. YIM S02556]
MSSSATSSRKSPASAAGKSALKGAAAVPAQQAWRDLPQGPVILLQGSEDYLAQRTWQLIREAERLRSPEGEVLTLDAATLGPGELIAATSPSLFSAEKLIRVQSLATMSDAFLADALEYLSSPAPECILVLQHSGGVRGKKLLDALKSGGAPVIDCQPLKKDADKLAFVSGEFARARRRIDPDAARALVAAVGAQLTELAAACSQLLSDVEGTIELGTVEKYYGGRVEATAFRVADAAVAGNIAGALGSLRHALSTGIDPVPLLAALAMKVRSVAKVYGARGSSAGLAKELGMAPWQIDQARREADRWSEEGLARAVEAMARADAEVKGAARDPIYALERAVTVVAQAAR